MFLKQRFVLANYNSIVLDYFQRDDRAHCIVLWFLALAFLDNAFEDFSTPAELFNARNCTTSNIPIRIRKSLPSIPIMRRIEGIGERRLSPTLACTAGSALTELQRVAFMLGLVGVRFTSYCIRRGVNNKISDNCAVPNARRKQLMGHTDPPIKCFGSTTSLAFLLSIPRICSARRRLVKRNRMLFI